MSKSHMVDDQVGKRVYVEPVLEKAQKLQDVTEGEAVVVTGAVPA